MIINLGVILPITFLLGLASCFNNFYTKYFVKKIIKNEIEDDLMHKKILD